MKKKTPRNKHRESGSMRGRKQRHDERAENSLRRRDALAEIRSGEHAGLWRDGALAEIRSGDHAGSWRPPFQGQQTQTKSESNGKTRHTETSAENQQTSIQSTK